MPEGDVVLRTARRLDAALRGRQLQRADLRWPSLAAVDLTSRAVLEVVATGKHLLIRLGPRDPLRPDRPDDGQPLTLHSHLRMEGSWHVHRTGEPWRGARDQDGVRAVLGTDTWTAIGHRLGMLDLVATEKEADLVGHLGPDVLAPAWDPAAAARRIAARPELTIGEALLDQRLVAGIGTFFMAEAAFLRGISPWTPVPDVDLDRLLDTVHRLMAANVTRAVQVTTGNARRGEEQWVHSRSGRPCRRCGTTVRVAPIGVAPQDRVAFWCPRCQPGPAPTDDGRAQAPLGGGGYRRTRS